MLLACLATLSFEVGLTMETRLEVPSSFGVVVSPPSLVSRKTDTSKISAKQRRVFCGAECRPRSVSWGSSRRGRVCSSAEHSIVLEAMSNAGMA
jgi:hypothetical protein